MMNTIAEENDFKSLTIPNLKIYLNEEHDPFKKDARQAALDHYEEANKNQFYPFSYDGSEKLNKDKCQAFGMQFLDAKFHHNNVIVF